jgi:hypothetical protein
MTTTHQPTQQPTTQPTWRGHEIEWRKRNYVFFSVQICLLPWTVLHQPDLLRYFFLGGKGMFLCFYVKKNVPVDTV